MKCTTTVKVRKFYFLTFLAILSHTNKILQFQSTTTYQGRGEGVEVIIFLITRESFVEFWWKFTRLYQISLETFWNVLISVAPNGSVCTCTKNLFGKSLRIYFQQWVPLIIGFKWIFFYFCLCHQKSVFVCKLNTSSTFNLLIHNVPKWSDTL